MLDERFPPRLFQPAARLHIKNALNAEQDGAGLDGQRPLIVFDLLARKRDSA
jgi:hypothetical protein